ncbi:MAG: hypothetical protein J7M25_14120, partial [Deltaproteobacteria bacterium]|nr:hypothetical protein [Deltaproteobacteria bacterium]
GSSGGGGKGGDGGKGGPGGGGGGGGGGPSMGIVTAGGAILVQPPDAGNMISEALAGQGGIGARSGMAGLTRDIFSAP